jgi:hypothetical protein
MSYEFKESGIRVNSIEYVTVSEHKVHISPFLTAAWITFIPEGILLNQYINPLLLVLLLTRSRPGYFPSGMTTKERDSNQKSTLLEEKVKEKGHVPIMIGVRRGDGTRHNFLDREQVRQWRSHCHQRRSTS